ncbi:MAG: hypothetical protein AABX82_02630 [Nanoarchaeota archaeon]
MKSKTKFCFVLFVLIFLMSCETDDEVVFMPASLCQVTCTDDATGNTYGIALRAIAWNDEDDPGTDYDKYDDGNFGCNVYVDAYRGEMDEFGNFVTGPVVVEYGGSDLDQRIDEDYTLTFFDLEGEGDWSDALTSIAEDYTAFYQLLDESSISIAQSDTAIAVEYVHRINPCVMNAQLEVNVYCNSAETADSAETAEGHVGDYVRISCDPSDDDSIVEENDDGNNIQCEDNKENEACLDEDYEINEDDIENIHYDIWNILEGLSEE